jgi:hypothetical protein
VTLDCTDDTVAFTLEDYERFVNEALDFDIPSDTPIGIKPSWIPSEHAPLLVQRIEVIE